MILWQGTTLAAIGIALGVGAAMLLTRLLQNLVHGVSTLDPLTFAVVPAVLLCVGIAASLTPAIRAAGLDPVVTLRR
jgi:putative ABC transport system permease protein